MIASSSVLRATLALRPSNVSRGLRSRRASTGSTPSVDSSQASTSTGSSSKGSLKVAMTSIGLLGAGGASVAWQTGLSPSELFDPSLLVQKYSDKFFSGNFFKSQSTREASQNTAPLRVESESESAPPQSLNESEPVQKIESDVVQPEPEAVAQPQPEVAEQEEVATQVTAEEVPLNPEQVDPPAPVIAEVLPEATQATKEVAALTLAKAEAERLAGIERRNLARQELIAAVDSRDVLRIQDAIKAASDAHLGERTEVAVARSFLPPQLPPQACLQTSAAVISMPSGLQELDPAQAEVAEHSSTEEMSVEQLQARVVELSRFLAAGRLYNKARFAEALLIPLETAELEGVERLEEALAHLKADSDAASEARCAALDTQLKEQSHQTVLMAKAEASMEADQTFMLAGAQLKEAAETDIAEVKSNRISDVVSFSSGLREIQEALQGEASGVEGSYTLNFFSNAVTQLENALSAGRACEEELQKLCSVAREADTFAADILEALPASCKALCREGQIPTEASIKKALNVRVGELTSAAFLPPGGGLAAEIVAQLFQSVYVLNSGVDASVEPENSAGQDVRNNLTALKCVSDASTPGELQTAFLNLETALTGSCRDRAEEHLVKLRSALLLRQAISVIKARVLCLSTLSAE